MMNGMTSRKYKTKIRLSLTRPAFKISQKKAKPKLLDLLKKKNV